MARHGFVRGCDKVVIAAVIAVGFRDEETNASEKEDEEETWTAALTTADF